MKVIDLLKDPAFSLVAGKNVEKEIHDFYTGDLLSWVMSHAEGNDAWLTVQTHLNILAVADLIELSCIIIVDDAVIEQETIDKAEEVNITLIHTTLSAVEVIRWLDG